MRQSEFTSLFNEHYAALVVYALKITNDQAAAEDIAEETFIKFWKKSESETEILSQKSYLFTITRNGCLTWVRKNKAENARYKSIPIEGFERTALEAMIYAETMAKVYAAVDSLPGQCRKVFIMHFIKGMKLTEIATELGIGLGTVNTHKVRGLQILQRTLLGMPLVLIIEVLKASGVSAN